MLRLSTRLATPAGDTSAAIIIAAASGINLIFHSFNLFWFENKEWL
jgi:hypothetical protein